MLIVCVNGTINSGKSTIGRLLAERLPDARFIEGDDHDGHDLPFEQMITHAVHRLTTIIGHTTQTLVIAYPLREEDYARLLEATASRDLRLVVVTLSPPLDVALSDRGKRTLDAGESARIRQMYLEGYQQRQFSDLVITGTPSTCATVEMIADFVAR